MNSKSIYIGKRWRHLPTGKQGKCRDTALWGGKLFIEIDVDEREWIFAPVNECCPALYVVGSAA